jgi:mono/diheme cytochrome c family protein
LYEAHCLACHGAGGEGDGPGGAGLSPAPANLKAMSAHHSDGDLAWKIAEGRGPMPAWKAVLKSKQIWDVVNYLRALAAP